MKVKKKINNKIKTQAMARNLPFISKHRPTTPNKKINEQQIGKTKRNIINEAAICQNVAIIICTYVQN